MREMRRKDRAMAQEAAQEVLNTAQYGILATINEDGTPYGVPLSFVYRDQAIYFHSATTGQKLDNIAWRDDTCFTVVTDTEVLPAAFSTKYKSVMVFGKVQLVEDLAEKKQAAIYFIEKYSRDFYQEGLAYIDKAIEQTKFFRLDITAMTGKAKI